MNHVPGAFHLLYTNGGLHVRDAVVGAGQLPVILGGRAERALAGDEDACRALVSRYERSVYNLLSRMLRDHALAQRDVVAAVGTGHTWFRRGSGRCGAPPSWRARG